MYGSSALALSCPAARNPGVSGDQARRCFCRYDGWIGGHTAAIAERLVTGFVLSCDAMENRCSLRRQTRAVGRIVSGFIKARFRRLKMH